MLTRIMSRKSERSEERDRTNEGVREALAIEE